MTSRRFCVAMGLLWLVTVAVVGWFFVKGTTQPSRDGRKEIMVAAGERDLILGEMRQLLKAVHGVTTGWGTQGAGLKDAERAARAAGMAMAADERLELLAKLPLAFKQLGMSVHQDMDNLADGIAQGETTQQVLIRVSSITARCTACHDLYRLSDAR